MKQTEDEILIILIEHLKQIGWTLKEQEIKNNLTKNNTKKSIQNPTFESY